MLAALVAAVIVIVIVISVGKRAPIAPALVIAALVAFAELTLTGARRRAAQLHRMSHDLSRANQDLKARVSDLSARLSTVAQNQLASESTLPAAEAHVVVPVAPVESAPVPAVPVSLAQFVTRDRRLDDAQCPRCGRFFVDGPLKGSSNYQCRACGATWAWQRGTPWPDVAVVPDARALRRDATSPS